MAKSTTKKVSKMDQAIKIFEAAFKKPLKGKTPRQTAIYQFQTKLGMAPTAAATYFSHCMKKVREAQHEQVATSKKQPWSAVKVDGSGTVTSYGHFLTQAAALEFNSKYEHDGIIRGAVNQGDVINIATLKTA